jgi:hypothetical protein
VRSLALLLLLAGCKRPHASFSRDVWPVLQQQCAQAKGCHGDEPTDSVSLDLRRDRAYAELVGRPAQARKGALRVAAANPGASFLVDKLTGTLGPREGKQMPIDENTGAPTTPVPPEFIAKLKDWIAAGAPND